MAPSSAEFYRAGDAILAQGIGNNSLPISYLCRPEAAILGEQETQFYRDRAAVLDAFFDACLTLFQDAVSGRADPIVSQFLFNDTPVSLGRKFHQQIPKVLFRRPRTFRTDESLDGRIMEIQCPGSGWGDLQLLRDIYSEFSSDTRLRRYRPAQTFASSVVQAVGDPSPTVLHLLDNASSPASMEYLIRATQPPLRYWARMKGVKQRHCDYVRSHSFFGLAAENYFRHRLREAAEGKVLFDLPPIVLFDQKAPLALPFWDRTRQLFSEAIRKLFIYSYPVTPKGFKDEFGYWVTLEDLETRSPPQRQYFVKYAGSDVSSNWGSQAVHFLGDRRFRKYLARIREDFGRRRCWIIQPAALHAERVSYHRRQAFEESAETICYMKRSVFYAEGRMIGIKDMSAEEVTVHGQPNTIVGLGVPSNL